MSNELSKPENQTIVNDATIQGDDGNLYVPLDLNPAVDFPLMTYGDAMLAGSYKVGGLIDFIGGLVQAGWIVDALNLLRLVSNDATTIGQLKAAIADLIAKNKKPAPPKMMAWDAMGKKAPNREEVLTFLKGKGLDTSKVSTPMLGWLISLAIRFGLPFLEKIIENLIAK